VAVADVFLLAKRIRNLGPEERLPHAAVADTIEHLGHEIELLRRGTGHEARTVTVVTGGDWHGLYVDGRLIHQAERLVCHSVALRRLIAELGGTSDWVSVPADWVMRNERFPARLQELLGAAAAEAGPP